MSGDNIIRTLSLFRPLLLWLHSLLHMQSLVRLHLRVTI